MKKKLLLLMLLVLIPFKVKAASIDAYASSTRITLNNTFTVTVKVSHSANIGSWQYNLNYDSSKLSLQSGETAVVGYGDGTYSSKSYYYTFKAIANGSASISISNASIVDWDSETKLATSSSGVTVTIKAPVVYNYSSDNNLSALAIEGFNLSPIFAKSTLKYSVTVLPTTTSVKINATVADKTAKVTGTGDIPVVEGTNTLNVVVTAENGTTKTYEITVTVPEKNPIEYTFNKVKYQILRKLPETLPANYTQSTKTFNGEEVPCLVNDKLKLTLLYLKNNNLSNFYIYDEKNKTVTLYNEIKTSETTIYYKEITDKTLAKFTKSTIKINGEQIPAYQIVKGSNYYIIYAINTITNKGNYYLYDSKTGNFIIFNLSDLNSLINKIALDEKIIIGVGSLSLVLFLIIILILVKNKKKLKKIQEKILNKNKPVTEEKVEKKEKSNA